jgi:hypothetical protein
MEGSENNFQCYVAEIIYGHWWLGGSLTSRFRYIPDQSMWELKIKKKGIK